MAVIGKIRERGNLLVILVGGALLLFVLDALLSNNKGGGGSGGQAIGEIAGEQVSAIDFSDRVEEQANLYRENGTNVDNQMQEQIRNNVWQEILRERTLRTQATKAGLGTTLSAEEYDDIRWGDNVVSDFENNENFKDKATGQLDKALEHARIEYQRRPENIDACETLAWVLYKKGQVAEAAPLVTTMMRTKSQNPERMVKAGLIMLANGQAEGKEMISQGLALKPYLDETLAQEAAGHISG